MSPDAAASDLEEAVSALRHSTKRLAAAVAPLAAEQLTGPSYASEWSIAQALSHIGSGAEIMGRYVAAGVRGEAPPGGDQNQPVWDRWNAKGPEQVARDAVAADAEFLGAIEALSETQRRDWRLSLFGSDQMLADLVRLRLAEQAVHTWDVVVMLDPQATVAPDAAAQMIDRLGMLVGYVGKPTETPLRVLVTTEAPQRRLLLEFDADGARLTPAEPDAVVDAEVRLSAEAFVRLLYGRLDPKHTPSVVTEDVDLDVLRQAFPGV